MQGRERSDGTPQDPRPGMAPGDEAPPGTHGTGEDICPECKGSGQVAAGECPRCAGSGRVIKGIGGA